MPSVKHLFSKLNQENKSIILSSIDEPLISALNQMIEYDYTQLPVKGDENQYFLVTTQSILKTLYAFGTRIDTPGLTVGNALVNIHKHYEEDDLFDVMMEIERNGAALILDNNNNLFNIVTSYDTTLYFRQWSEDIMNVREIERELKEIINSSFKKDDGVIDKDSRQGIIDNVSAESKKIEKIVQESIRRYLTECISGTTPDNEAIKRVSEFIINEKQSKKKVFEDLTLDEYIKIFFVKCWPACTSALSLDKDAISFILEGVRRTRNKLAHFHKDDITAQDRSQLRTCNDLLRNSKKNILTSFTEQLSVISEGS